MVSNARLPKTVDGAGFIKFRQEYGESLMTEAEMVAQPGKFADPRNLAAAGIDLLAWYTMTNRHLFLHCLMKKL